jgi:exonuclease III
VSTKNKKTLQKIVCLTKTNADAILLSDLKLNSLIQSAAVHDIKKKFDFNKYTLHHNSPFASRGVGIAIKKSTSLTLIEKKCDRIGNILGMKFSTGTGTEIAFVSVYGPNENEREFYTNLKQIIADLNCTNLIIGGDWNSTWDASPAIDNLDVINMQNIPSRFRSDQVLNIANRYNLTDPFRFLNPNKRDYTYIPNAAANRNRSRIDFFLLSHNLLSNITDTGIETGRLTTLFDHKAVFLKLGTKKINIDRNKICNGILENKIIELIVEITVKEFYLNNSDPNAVPGHIKNPLKLEIGRIYNFLKQATNLELGLTAQDNLDQYPDPEPVFAEINLLTQHAMDIAETLPDLNYFQSLPLDIDPANFFEGLIMSIKNEILSKQSSIYKIKNRKKKLLRERICELKKNIHANFEEIHRQEQILDELIESDLRVELEKYKISERVNSEKITPQFMNLIRCVNSNKDSDLSVVCDANGNTFNTDAEQNVYITNTFADIYSKPINADGSARNPLPGNCITQFLGDIAEHPSVRDSKLTEEEKYQFDSALTVEEFDKAVKQIKIKSAPGLDGISNKFIKKFWPFFRKPIFDYTNFCLERGELTESFKTAKIKLIPKKGDLKKIGNWRPISLLNCFYKIISRVITN